jgi:hypothetical protein
MPKKYETRRLPEEEALAFIQNMRWFAGMGRITAKRNGDGTVTVRATRHAWSNFICYQ